MRIAVDPRINDLGHASQSALKLILGRDKPNASAGVFHIAYQTSRNHWLNVGAGRLAREWLRLNSPKTARSSITQVSRARIVRLVPRDETR